MGRWLLALLVGALLSASCSSGDDSGDTESLSREGISDAVEDVIADTPVDERDELHIENVRGTATSDRASEFGSAELIEAILALTDEELLAEGYRFCGEVMQFEGDPAGLGVWLDELYGDPAVEGMTPVEIERFLALGSAVMIGLCPEMFDTMQEYSEDLRSG